MNKLIITTSVLALVAASATLVTADNLNNEVVPMLYLNVPIGGQSATQKAPVYGAAFGITETSPNSAGHGKSLNVSDTGRARLLDLRFKQGGVDSLKVNGVSLMQKVITLNADGSTSTTMGTTNLTPAQWAIIALGVGATLCVGEVICDDNKKEPYSPPPPGDDVVLDAVADGFAPE